MTDGAQTKKLLEQAKKGDSDAFGELYEFYVTPIFRFIYFRVKNKEIAEDLTQTVFLKVYSHLDRIENNYPRAYLYTVAKNVLTDHWRKKKTDTFDETAEDFQQPADDSPHIDAVIDQKMQAEKIKASLDVLSDEQREVLVLKFIQEFSNKEIAAMLDKNEDAIRQTQCRALKVLRAHLKEKKIL